MLSIENLPLTSTELLLARQEFNQKGYTSLFENQAFVSMMHNRLEQYSQKVSNFLKENTDFNSLLIDMISQRFTDYRFSIPNNTIETMTLSMVDDSGKISEEMTPNDFFALALIFSESATFQQLIADTSLFTIDNFVSFLFETRVTYFDVKYYQTTDYIIVNEELEQLHSYNFTL